jgi:hypothetical protein
MSRLVSDFRHSFRLLAAAPGFSTVAVLILGFEIGANTAVFSVVNTLALQPRPGPIPSATSRIRSIANDCRQQRIATRLRQHPLESRMVKNGIRRPARGAAGSRQATE